MTAQPIDGFADSVCDPDEDVDVGRWKPQCSICIEGSLPGGWAAWLAKEPKKRRVFAWERVLKDDERKKALAYLCDPKCTVERHKWAEDAELFKAHDAIMSAEMALDEAMDRYAEMQRRPPGWSIKKPETVKP
jgi:hypothetical protein